MPFYRWVLIIEGIVVYTGATIPGSKLSTRAKSCLPYKKYSMKRIRENPDQIFFSWESNFTDWEFISLVNF